MKGKYNTGVPIDINELSEEERKIAFHEWAEGSIALEKLLNDGYERGIISSACCGGDSGHPYVMYKLHDDNSRKMAMFIAKQLVDSNVDCQIIFEHDFYNTEEDYKEMREHLIKTFPEDFSEENLSATRTITCLSIYTKMQNREEIFESISNYIRDAKLDNIKLPESEEDIPTKTFNTPSKQENEDQINNGNRMLDESISEGEKCIKLGDINIAGDIINQVEQEYINKQNNPQTFVDSEPDIVE